MSSSYDPTYQLTNERRSGANVYNITYSYDPVGNRSLMQSGGALTTYTYNAANEPATSQTSAGTTTYTFDGSGNQFTSQAPGNQRTTNTWDGENRLTQVSLPSGIRNTFSYNGDGQRVVKQDSMGTTRHVWDGQNVLLETDGSNVIQVVYTLEPQVYGNLISQRRSGTSSFFLFDGMDSTRQLTSATGLLTDGYVYDSWGCILASIGSTSNSFRYTGRLGDYFDTDLTDYYLRVRYYSPSLGRFRSRDPVYEVTWYVYVSNRPSHSVDPSGLFAAPAEGKSVTPYFPVNDTCKKACDYAAKQRAKMPPPKQWVRGLDNPGMVVCSKGTMCACVLPAKGYPDPGDCNAYDKCVLDHEKAHFQDNPKCPENIYTLTAYPDVDQKAWDAIECKRRKPSLKCLNDIIANPSPGCAKVIDKIKHARDVMDKWITNNCHDEC